MSNIDDILAGLTESLKRLQQASEQKLADEQNAKVESQKPSQSPLTKGTKFTNEYYSKIADDYIEFTYKNPTIYHVVQTFKKQLEDNGFTYLPESSSWSDLKAGKYFTVRNGSSLAAFVVGDKWTPSNGVGAIGSHIDSLTTVLKPNSTKAKVDGVAPYAGTLGDVWWDRDLGVGGRLLVKGKSGKVSQQLVDSTPHPIAHIPTLAPHFGAPANGPFNTETQAVPVIGFTGEGDEDEEEPATEAEKNAPLYGKHPLKLLRYIAGLADVEVADILQWDLQLYDIQKGTKGGLKKEFVFAPRVDDRVCSFAALNALIDSTVDGTLAKDSFSIVGLYDNEEIGSLTRQGAKGGLIELVVNRVLSSEFVNPEGVDIQESLRLTYANSIILSADVNHLLNPNFAQVYLDHHKPLPNVGVTLSLDPNGHMATDSIGLALAEELARKNGDKVQYFQIRNDSRSGGTIGPSISVQTGARTIDLGIPQLSMHSIRATLGSKDIGLGIKFFYGFFKNWRETYNDFVDL
ncbi:APE1 Vacuolar aminopeptidase 1 [Candida maltosa Xu316]